MRPATAGDQRRCGPIDGGRLGDEDDLLLAAFARSSPRGGATGGRRAATARRTGRRRRRRRRSGTAERIVISDPALAATCVTPATCRGTSTPSRGCRDAAVAGALPWRRDRPARHPRRATTGSVSTTGRCPSGPRRDWAVLPSCGAVVLVQRHLARPLGHGAPPTSATGVTVLEYEAYDEQVVPRLRGDRRRAAPAAGPTVGRVVLLHRVGAVPVGESSVVVVVSRTAPRRRVRGGPLRDRHASRPRVPIWKREIWPGGADWGSRRPAASRRSPRRRPPPHVRRRCGSRRDEQRRLPRASRSACSVVAVAASSGWRATASPRPSCRASTTSSAEMDALGRDRPIAEPPQRHGRGPGRRRTRSCPRPSRAISPASSRRPGRTSRRRPTTARSGSAEPWPATSQSISAPRTRWSTRAARASCSNEPSVIALNSRTQDVLAMGTRGLADDRAHARATSSRCDRCARARSPTSRSPSA